MLPSAAVLEMIVHQARARAESTVHRALVDGLATNNAGNPRSAAGAEAEETIAAWLGSGLRSSLRLPAIFWVSPSACVSCARSASTVSGGKTSRVRHSSGSPTRDYG